MASKRRNMFYQNEKQETTEIEFVLNFVLRYNFNPAVVMPVEGTGFHFSFSLVYNHQRRIALTPPLKFFSVEEEVKSQKRMRVVGTERVEVKKIYKCDSCGFYSTSASGLKTHVSRLHVVCPDEAGESSRGKEGTSRRPQIYECDACPFKTTLNIGLKRHKVKVHSVVERTENIDFRCDLCNFVSTLAIGLNIHKMKVHRKTQVAEPSGAKLQCDVCGFQTQYSIGLKRHKLQAHGSINPPPPSPASDSSGEMVIDYDSDATHSDTGLKLEVTKSKKNSGSTQLMELLGSMALKYTNEVEVPVKTEPVDIVCFETEPTPEAVEEVAHKCPKCFYVGTSAETLAEHDAMAHCAEVLKCGVCGYETVSALGLRRHKVAARHGDHQCHLCHFRAYKANVLARHLGSAHPETGHVVVEEAPVRAQRRPRRQLHCDQCPFVTTRKSLLTRHAIVHTGQPYKTCHVCGFVATTDGRLSQHMVKHAAPNLIECGLCFYKTASLQALKKHTAKKHGVKSPNSESLPLPLPPVGLIEFADSSIRPNDDELRTTN
ncbi:hypothetical protein AAG570_007141 [Ranatra chinensis]|uniref:C2H2-type domain-containing protein n=1 Tax=Ranatra chinensis TaxID=642074 RepID=A0ABD0XWX9_9HEMI